ncbi:exonuclease SbcCD subunit D [Isoptericola croceus]|uniref:exonuclease SbcCD subunit D n=1 Tax=Isoptericola croceus TaxID=3031406 RepID=UPI0023F92A8A|nr:exonuclease SbcCD subunit D [Isoptericola croceus]
MRILHTSDWHLGRTLHGVDLIEHQAAYVDHLVELTRTEGVDAVLVAGDVYDRAIPPVDAVSLLSDAISRLAEHAAVVVTPGNHDSAVRLGFGAGIMRPGVHVRASVPDVGTPVLLDPARGGGPVLVYPLPYLDPDAVRRELADGSSATGSAAAHSDEEVTPLARSHEAVTAAAMRRVGADLARRRDAGTSAPAVVMAHAFVVGGLASESERDIRVGGVDSVPAGVFGGWGLDYVALGHLHGPQVVTVPEVSRERDGTDGTDGSAGTGTEGRPPLARYSGSPLAYSFSEMHQKKSTVLVDLAAGSAPPHVELIPAPVPRRLAEVTGSLDDLLGAAGEPHVADWLRVVVTDPARPAELFARVRARFPHALQIQHRPPVAAERETIALIGAGHDPLEVTRDFVDHVTGAPPSPDEDAALRSALELAVASERSA